MRFRWPLRLTKTSTGPQNPLGRVVLTVGIVAAILVASLIAAEVAHNSGSTATFASQSTLSPTTGDETGVVVITPDSPTSPAPSTARGSASATSPLKRSTVGAAPTAVAPQTTAATGPGAAADPPPAAGAWPLSAAPGSSNVPDSAGGHPGTSQNVQWASYLGIGYGEFNGTDSQITTSGPVLDTGPGSSFTVSAWVYMTSFPEFATAVSQDAAESSAFYLQYSGPNNAWSFSRVTGDSVNPQGIRATSVSPPTLDSWTHLVGVFDGTDNQMQLYVNGAPQNTVTDNNAYTSDGPLAIGRGEAGGQPVDWFPGDIRNVQVFSQALTPAQVKALPEL